eukprot:CAMPEP_0196575752 /NCGR_PEP_ID=MMETSP1081-20130531/5173_1 /TAXON_ID=36882 /ORGANISM="Pyramimonas amylifera, Strain CCMP720" /LENGTH=440 /DNA_ID=CAMNT_0041894153 /DNA_START=212 /DNA_END=1534 /DNA_ORIENTATION=+
MTCMDVPASRETERWESNAGNISEVEDDIPEMIAESALEACDNDGAGTSSSEDYGVGDPPGSYQVLRQLTAAQRASPSSSHAYHTNAHHHQNHARYYAPSGQLDYGDSDEDEEFEAYEGEEFERYEEEGEEDEEGGACEGDQPGGGMSASEMRQREDEEDYDLSRYHRHLRLYDHMLGHHHHHHQEVDGNDDADEYNEVSDVEDEEEEFIPDLLSDHEGEGIGEYISDEDRSMEAHQLQLSDLHRSSCAQFVSSSSSPSGLTMRGDGNHYQHHHQHGQRQQRELPRSPHSATWAPAHFRLGSLGRRERATRSLDPHSGHQGYELRSERGVSRSETGKLKSAAPACVSPDAPNWTPPGWLHSGLFCANFLKKKPSEEVQRVLEDKEWVYDLLKSLPGVNPDDNGIQGTLAALRGLTGPAHESMMKAQIPSHRMPDHSSFSK